MDFKGSVSSNIAATIIEIAPISSNRQLTSGEVIQISNVVCVALRPYRCTTISWVIRFITLTNVCDVVQLCQDR